MNSYFYSGWTKRDNCWLYDTKATCTSKQEALERSCVNTHQGYPLATAHKIIFLTSKNSVSDENTSIALANPQESPIQFAGTIKETLDFIKSKENKYIPYREINFITLPSLISNKEGIFLPNCRGDSLFYPASCYWKEISENTIDQIIFFSLFKLREEEESFDFLTEEEYKEDALRDFTRNSTEKPSLLTIKVFDKLELELISSPKEEFTFEKAGRMYKAIPITQESVSNLSVFVEDNIKYVKIDDTVFKIKGIKDE